MKTIDELCLEIEQLVNHLVREGAYERTHDKDRRVVIQFASILAEENKDVWSVHAGHCGATGATLEMCLLEIVGKLTKLVDNEIEIEGARLRKAQERIDSLKCYRKVE